MATSFSYIRFSTPTQAAGDSLRRQTQAAKDWCARNGAVLDETLTFRDLGRSAFLGKHKENPDRYALAAFLKLVEQGKVPRGSFLIIESLDRLTREHVRAGLMLLLGLIENGVRIVQLSPSELIYDEQSDEMGLMLAIVELSRGHRESKRKSDLCGAAWEEKRKRAREDGELMTSRIPHWIEKHGDGLRLIPERAALVRKVYALAAAGYGLTSIVKKLIEDGDKPFGFGDHWARSYVARLMLDRRAVGEFQPCSRRNKSASDPIPGYYPAVVTEAEWLAARAGLAQRKTLRGRMGKNINMFAGLMRSARDGESYFIVTRVERGGRQYQVLMNTSGQDGRGQARSFPFPVFERAILSKLDELDPHEILNGDHAPDETLTLAAQVAGLEAELMDATAFMEKNGFSPTIGKRVQLLEERKRDLTAQLTEARQKAANPLSETWGEVKSLLTALDAAADPVDARLRLRAGLRRIVDSIWLLVVPRGRDRLAAVQIWFAEAKRQRSYLIHHRPPKANASARTVGATQVLSFADDVGPDALDLRKPEDARAIEAVLTTLKLS